MTADVLIVEDDPDIREAIAEVLLDDGIDSEEAANGQEALDRLQGGGAAPRVILLDLMMPGMDGWTFRAAQRATPALAGIPVVVLTAHSNAEQAAAKMGASGWLKKPVSLDTLIGMVRRFVARGDGAARKDGVE